MRFWSVLIVRLVSDIIFIYLSFVSAYFIKFGIFLPVNVYTKLIIFVVVVWLVIFNLGGLYKFPKKEGRREDNILAASFAITSAAFITLLIIFFLYKEAAYAMDLIFYSWFSALILINLSRSIIWFGYQKFSK